MGRKSKTIRVRDHRGIMFKVFEREIEEILPFATSSRKLVQTELETGEPGRFLDPETFELKRTGERFVRVRRKKRSPV